MNGMAAIMWLEAGFDATLHAMRRTLTEFEAEYVNEDLHYASPGDIAPNAYLRRFRPVGYVRRGSVFFSIKEDNELDGRYG